MHIQENVELKNLTSLRVGGKADKLVKVETGDSLTDIISQQKPAPVWVFGYGTNCLISDKGLAGAVIFNQGGKIQKQGNTKVKVDSGVVWDRLVQFLIQEDLWGLEFTSGIPGGVGAAIAGNIAAYGHKVADKFIEATVMNQEDGTFDTWGKDELGFGYRSSKLQQPGNQHKVVVDATFELSAFPADDLEYESALKVSRELGVGADSLDSRRKIIIETRRRAESLLGDLSAGPWTAGSFFKNPLVDEAQLQAVLKFEENSVSHDQLLRQNQIHGLDRSRVSAALVLLAAGFARGQTWGSVRLNPNHILKIENTGGATASQIYAVAQEIIVTVKQKLGIDLEPEVRFIGEF